MAVFVLVAAAGVRPPVVHAVVVQHRGDPTVVQVEQPLVRRGAVVVGPLAAVVAAAAVVVVVMVGGRRADSFFV